MYAYAKYWFFGRPVAFALVGVVALGILTLLPARETAARPAADYGPPISGTVRVIDGDTIVVDSRHIRLEGIDAPEIAQRCGRRFFGTWACGAAATHALASIVAGRSVTCDSRGDDAYGRTLGVCFVNGQDINAHMVREGFAWAFVKYSKSYVREEAEAKSARAGIWSGEAEPAWLFRHN
ncbi:MAG: thermonuclease family protein, partial [Hyphomicrobium sp.]